MTRSLYTKFLLGYLVFGLLGFIFIATMSSEITYQYLLEEKSDSLYDEANLLASTYSDIYQGKNISLSTANPQLQAVATYLKAQAWVINQKGSVVAETAPASHIGTAIDGFDPTVAGNRSYMTGRFFGMFDKDMLRGNKCICQKLVFVMSLPLPAYLLPPSAMSSIIPVM